MAGRFITKKTPREEQFLGVSDMKLRMTLITMADRFDEQVRDHIYAIYRNPVIAQEYRSIINSGIYEKGGKSKVHKKIIEFPDGYVYDFVDTTMRALYGSDWLKNPKALKHELVKPWWVVAKI